MNLWFLDRNKHLRDRYGSRYMHPRGGNDFRNSSNADYYAGMCWVPVPDTFAKLMGVI